jgi:hypothetical protein
MPGDIIELEARSWVVSARGNTPTGPMGALLKQNRRCSNILDVEVFKHCEYGGG